MVAPLLANWAKLKLVVGLWEGEGALLGRVRGGSACSASALNKLHSTSSSATAIASSYSSDEFWCVQGGVEVHVLLVWGKEQTDSLLVVCWVRLTTVHHSSIPWVSAVLRVDPSCEGGLVCFEQLNLKIFLSKPTS